MENFIYKIRLRKNGAEHKEKHYASTCPHCGVFKGYVRKSRANIACLTCSGKNIGKVNAGKPGPNLGKQFSEEVKAKMSHSRQGRIPWNKGLKGVSEETSKKMSINKLGKAASNAGSTMTNQQKILLSCINQGINIEDFGGFVTPTNRLERAKFYEQKLHIKCFEKHNYTCDKCGIRGTSIHAHHMNSWAFFKEERFDLNNLVCLCKKCHKEFHLLFGNGKATPNTKEQYLDFKSDSK